MCMKKKITMLLAGLIPAIMLSAQVPMVVAGDMKVAGQGQVLSKGDVNVTPSGKVEIESQGKVKVNEATFLKASSASKSIIVNKGELTLEKGIIFQSNDDKDGMLYNQGTVVAPQTVSNVKVRKTFNDPSIWYYISFPFNVSVGDIKNADASGTPLALRGNLWLRYYDSQKRADNGTNSGNFIDITSTSYVLEAGVGYLIGVDIPAEVEFPATGNISNLFTYADKAKTIKYYVHAADKYPDGNSYGWNFIGGMNTTSFLMNPANTGHSTIYYYDYGRTGNAKGYKYRVLDISPAVLSPYVPFFVQTDDVTTTFNYKKAGLGINDANPLEFRSDNAGSKEVLVLKITDEKSVYDNAHVIFSEEYQPNFKVMEDAVKMFSEQVPQIWSKVNNVSLCVNRLPLSDKEIQLGVSVPEKGNYTLSLSDEFPTNLTQVILLDKQTGSRTDLLTGSYQFRTESSLETSDRFVLLAPQTVTSLDPLKENGKIYAFVENDQLTVKGIVSGDQVRVYNLMGQTVVAGVAKSDEIVLPLGQKGTFIVRVNGTGAGIKVLNK